MKTSSLLSALVVLVLLVSLSSGTRYTVSFQGLVGRLCGSGAPSGCPDPSPCYISGSPTASSNPGASSSSLPGASSSTGPTASSGAATSSTGPTSSTGAATSSTGPTASSGAATSSNGPTSSTGAATSSTGPTSSTGAATSSTGPTSSTGAATSSLAPSGGAATSSLCPVASSCPVVASCAPCLCATPSSFPSFSRPASPTSAASNSGTSTGTPSPTRSISPSFTPTPSPNPCGPQYEAATTNSFGIGMLFDRTTWARDNDNPAVYGALYAINQINAAGGILIGNKNVSLNPVFFDTQGLPNSTVAGANSLIHASCVSVMIGTDDASQRRAVEANVLDSTSPSNAAPGLLLNPNNYEGADANPGVINFGNNLLTNVRFAIQWAVANNRTHIHLLGSDDIDSRVANAYARQYIANNYPQILIIGEDYMPVGTSEFTAPKAFLAPLFIGTSLFNNAVGNPCPNNGSCNMLLSTVFGQASNRVLYSALAARYLTPNNPSTQYVVMALRNSVFEFLNFTNTNLNNQLMGTNYVDQVDAVNTAGVAAWKTAITSFIQASGTNITNDTRGYNLTTGVELRAYNAIRLWANAVAAAGTANPAVIRTAILNTTFNAPNGLVSVNATTRQAGTTTTPFYISRLTTPPLRGLIVTPIFTTSSNGFEQYPVAGNLTGADSYSTLVSGIRNYYLNTFPSNSALNISLGWEYPAIPSPTSK